MRYASGCMTAAEVVEAPVSEDINANLSQMHRRMVKAACAILAGTRQVDVCTAAEDIVQDAMLSCWLNGTPTEANIHNMVYFRAIDFLRQQDTRSACVGMDMTPPADFDDDCNEHEFDKWTFKLQEEGRGNKTDPRVMEIWTAAEQLTPTLKTTFYRFYFEGDTCEEIAARDGVNLSTILMRLQRARSGIQKILGLECDNSALSAA